MSQQQVKTFDDVPFVPLRKILSYLDIKDLFRMRAVSRKYKFIIENEIEVQTLCYSTCLSELFDEGNWWISGAFAQNFISSTRFVVFFDTFGQTILSNLKRLSLYEVDLSKIDRAVFARALNSFDQLEHLDITRAEFGQLQEFNLNLPMLTSLQLELVRGIEKLVLEAPRLREIKFLDTFVTDLKLKIVPGESVEKLYTNRLEYAEVKKLRNLQYLYVKYLLGLKPTLLSNLQQLKEIHTRDAENISILFEQKQRFGRTDLKIYLCGLLLNSPNDPSFYYYPSKNTLACLAEKRSRLADQIPFYHNLHYSEIEEFIPPDLQIDLLKRFTTLIEIVVDCSVQNIQRFLDLVKNCKNIVALTFCYYDQPQSFYDQLPEHLTKIRSLALYRPPLDLAFLYRMNHLLQLDIDWAIDAEFVRRVFEEFSVLFYFSFRHYMGSTPTKIYRYSKNKFVIYAWIHGERCTKTVDNLEEAINFLEKSNRLKKIGNSEY